MPSSDESNSVSTLALRTFTFGGCQFRKPDETGK
jgi:hypothetical protein